MLTCKIRAYKGTGSFLTVDGQTPITLYRNVSLQSENAGKIQTWSIPSLTSGVVIRPTAGTQYTLGIQTSDSNCQMVTINSQSGVNFISADGTGASGLYRIQLKSDSTKYLTASGKSAGSNVYWAAPNSSLESQIWQVVITEKVLEMPAGRNCNWNQFYSGVTSQLGGDTWGCTITTALDLVNFYGPKSYTMADIRGAWYPSFTWNRVWEGNLWVDPQRTDKTGQEAFAIIRAQIDLGRPVIVNIGSNYDNHTVMCYGYTSGGTSNAHFLVMDPAGSGRNNTSSPYGAERTLAESMTFNDHPEGIWSIRLTASKNDVKNSF